MKYSINNLKVAKKITKSELWLMDTSHTYILDIFSNTKEFEIIKIESKNKDDNVASKIRYKLFFWDKVGKQSEIIKAASTFQQYLRILFFYNIINIDNEIINTKSVDELFKSFLNKKIKLNFYENINTLFYEYYEKIFYNIKFSLEKAPIKSVIFRDFVNIISTAEIFINWYYFSNGQVFYNSNDFFKFKLKYYNHFKKIKEENEESYFTEFNGYFKLFDFFENLFDDLNMENIKQNESINKKTTIKRITDPEGIGKLGEAIINIILQSENNEYIWQSKIDKYAPYDFVQFKSNNVKKYIEVKTAGHKYNKSQFNLSANEKEFLDKEMENYELFYVDKIYLSSDKILKDLMTNKLKKETIDQYIIDKIIEIKHIEGKTLNNYHQYSYKNKGYWVHEI